MAEKRYYLGEKSRNKLREIIARVEGGKVSRRPTPTRRAPRGGGGSRGNIIIASVNEPLGVSSSDPSFSFDGAVPIVGTSPEGDAGTAVNLYAQDYADNDAVILFQDRESGDWYTERGGSAGSILVTFELTEDMTYSDVAKLAKPVDASGVIISGATAFSVVDEQQKFYGLTGYQGVGIKITDDYNSTGQPGYRIVTMEGPAQIVLVELAESYSMSGPTACTPLADEPFGRPHRGQIVNTGEGDTFEVYDDLDVVPTSATTGDKWVALWDEADEHYVFALPLGEPTVPTAEIYGILIADVPAAEINYDATRSFIGHGYAADAVIPLELVEEGGADGGDQLQAILDGESQKIMPAVNPVWTNIIKAGTATDADKPVICRGRIETWNIYTGGSVTEMEVFVLTDLFYPVTIMKGLANGAVTGSDFAVDGLTLLWGRDPGVTSLASVTNPDSWEADDDAYCLIMQKTDGTWQAIDLACPT